MTLDACASADKLFDVDGEFFFSRSGKICIAVVPGVIIRVLASVGWKKDIIEY